MTFNCDVNFTIIAVSNMGKCYQTLVARELWDAIWENVHKAILPSWSSDVIGIIAHESGSS